MFAQKTPWHLWLVGGLAILFNAIGVFDIVMHWVQGPAYLASAGMTPAQIEFYQGFPLWMDIVWAVGVFGAFIASALLLMRRRPAYHLFVIAFAAFMLNLLYIYALAGGGAVMGQEMAVTNIVIAVLLLLFAFYCRAMINRRILR